MKSTEITIFEDEEELKMLKRRADVANVIQLCFDPKNPEVPVITVQPQDKEASPFSLRVVDGAKALDAYEHPYAYAFSGQRRDEISYPWDEALDALNGLDEVDRGWVIAHYDRVRKGCKTAPSVLLGVIERQKPKKPA